MIKHKMIGIKQNQNDIHKKQDELLMMNVS